MPQLKIPKVNNGTIRESKSGVGEVEINNNNYHSTESIENHANNKSHNTTKESKGSSSTIDGTTKGKRNNPRGESPSTIDNVPKGKNKHTGRDITFSDRKHPPELLSTPQDKINLHPISMSSPMKSIISNEKP